MSILVGHVEPQALSAVRSYMMEQDFTHNRRHGRPRGTAAITLLTTLCVVAPASAGEPIDFVPDDTLLVWYARPEADAPPPSDQPSALQTLLDLGTRIAGQPLNREAQLNVRMVEMFMLATRYPYALALIDARAQPLENDPAARRVDRLKFALIVDNRQQSEPFLRLIQKTVNEQTDSAAASLVSKEAYGAKYQELRDRRLPNWSVIAWGHVDDMFVLTVGEDVWPMIAAVASSELDGLTEDPWYAVARGGRRSTALVEIFVSPEAIQDRLDPFIDGRAAAFFEAWDAERLHRAHWTLGYQGRALFCEAHFLVGEQTHKRVYADADFRDTRLLQSVPSNAKYAVFDLPVDRFLRRFFLGIMSIQNAKARANIERVWAEMQEKYGFDAQRDILSRLGRHIVLHNEPPHPLRLPLAVTTLIEIRHEPDEVQAAVETFCKAWRATLDEAAARSDYPPDFTVNRDNDGVWYLRFGPLAGLAWTVTDRYIITSWSPNALREYLHKIGSAAGQR